MPKTGISPKETYMKMMAEFARVQTYADLESVYFRYGTKKLISRIEAERAQINNATASYFDPSHDLKENRDLALASFIKGIQRYNREINTIQESVNGTTAFIILGNSNRPSETVSISFILENNQWKLTDESWEDLR